MALNVGTGFIVFKESFEGIENRRKFLVLEQRKTGKKLPLIIS